MVFSFIKGWKNELRAFMNFVIQKLHFSVFYNPETSKNRYIFFQLAEIIGWTIWAVSLSTVIEIASAIESLDNYGCDW